MVDSTLNVNLLDEAEGFGLPLWFLSDADFDKLMSVTKPRQEILDGIERDIERLEADLSLPLHDCTSFVVEGD